MQVKVQELSSQTGKYIYLVANCCVICHRHGNVGCFMTHTFFEEAIGNVEIKFLV